MLRRKIFSKLSPNWDEVALGNAAWKDQFIEAFFCGGSAEEQSNSSWFEFVLHVLSLPWKLVFALVPPTEYCGGWLCFFIALAMIGCVTIIIGDLASLLGCSMQISDLQTAITLVAMGTSLTKSHRPSPLHLLTLELAMVGLLKAGD
eukprot:Skav213843  [mRNA]  locus=scaffold315:357564:366766:+ [translate_table: standard]